MGGRSPSGSSSQASSSCFCLLLCCRSKAQIFPPSCQPRSVLQAAEPHTTVLLNVSSATSSWHLKSREIAPHSREAMQEYVIHSTDAFRDVGGRSRDGARARARARPHSPAQALAARGARFSSVGFDHRLISALLIKFSICFIVNEVRQAGTRSHSAKKKKNPPKSQRGTSENAIKGRKEERAAERERAVKRQNIRTENKSKTRARSASVTNAKPSQSGSLSGCF